MNTPSLIDTHRLSMPNQQQQYTAQQTKAVPLSKKRCLTTQPILTSQPIQDAKSLPLRKKYVLLHSPY